MKIGISHNGLFANTDFESVYHRRSEMILCNMLHCGGPGKPELLLFFQANLIKTILIMFLITEDSKTTTSCYHLEQFPINAGQSSPVSQRINSVTNRKLLGCDSSFSPKLRHWNQLLLQNSFQPILHSTGYVRDKFHKAEEYINSSNELSFENLRTAENIT